MKGGVNATPAGRESWEREGEGEESSRRAFVESGYVPTCVKVGLSRNGSEWSQRVVFGDVGILLEKW